jgi:hypothetical protein
MTRRRTVAFVHFLRHGGDPYQRIFRTLFNALVEGHDVRTAQDMAFAGTDLNEILAAFRDYLQALR